MKRLTSLNTHFTSNPTSVTRTTIHDNVAVLELNPPTKLIFLSYGLIKEIGDELTKLEQDPKIAVVILTGKIGSSSFATGADINELKVQTLNKQLYDDYFEREWFRVIPKFRKPLIAAINGMAFGGGLELAMMCDILLASEDAKLG